MNVALVHDYLYDYGGAERVLEVLHEMWPEAPVYTAWVDWEWLKRNKPEWSANWRIRTSWFQGIPFKGRLTSPLRFLAPYVWESFSCKAGPGSAWDFSNFDVVISSAAWFITKGIITRPETLHICYCHTPPRYLYGYSTAGDWQRSWLTRTYANLVNPGLRMYDYLAAQRVDVFVTNSENTKRRIEKFYRREAKVVYPPIGFEVQKVRNVRKVQEGDPSFAKATAGKYFLMVNRLVVPKRIDVAIKALKHNKLRFRVNGILKIVGTGRDEGRLKRLARGAGNIEFLGYVSDERLHELYAGCRAVIYLAEDEDFGITPVEAMSFGKPVIAVNSGGVKESVIDGKTGILLDNLSIERLGEVLRKFKVQSSKFKVDEIRKQAEEFSKERFKKEMRELVESEWAKLNRRSDH